MSRPERGERYAASSFPMLNVAVLGAGRMGRAVLRALAEADGVALAGVWARAGNELYGQDMSRFAGPGAAGVVACDDLRAVCDPAEVAIDFSLPGAIGDVLSICAETRTPLVCGVSGLAPDALASIRGAARGLPILYDRNMSVGIAVLGRLLGAVVTALGDGFEIEIHDLHHVHKIDAPSGTALMLGEMVAQARGHNLDELYYFDDGAAAPPSGGTIRFTAERRGEVPGEHTVVFRSASESLEFSHKVTDRQVFAEGALAAARWLVRQQPGLYTMQDAAAGSGPAYGGPDRA